MEIAWKRQEWVKTYRFSNIFALRPIELIPSLPSAASGTFVIRSRNFFDRAAARGTGDVWNSYLGTYFCDTRLSVRMEYLLHTHGGGKDRGIVGDAEEFHAEVAVGGWTQHARDHLCNSFSSRSAVDKPWTIQA